MNLLLTSPINAETIETLEDRHDAVRAVGATGRMMDAAAELQLALAKTQEAIALEETRGPA